MSAVGSKRKSIRTVIFRKDNQQGPAVEHRELCSMLCGSLDGRGVWGGMDVCMCVADSFTVHLQLSQHCSLALPQYKITI